MYSIFLRYIYSLTYFIHLGILGELYQIYNNGLWPSVEGDWKCISIAYELFAIHYPLLFVVFCLVVCKLMVKHVTALAPNTIQMRKADSYGITELSSVTSLFPYITLFFDKDDIKIIGVIGIALFMSLFLVSHGIFNLSVFLLRYRQYKVHSNDSDYWLISKRRLSNFSDTIQVCRLQDNIIVKV